MITESYKLAVHETDIEELADQGQNAMLREQLGMNTDVYSPNEFLFREMTEEEGKVFKELFPRRVKIEEYEKFVPTEVLALTAEFKEKCPFEVIDIRVWEARTYDPDPIMVGYAKTGTHTTTQFLIARWGDALAPFVELKEKAIKQWRESRLATLRKIKYELEGELTATETCNDIYSSSQPSFYS